MRQGRSQRRRKPAQGVLDLTGLDPTAAAVAVAQAATTNRKARPEGETQDGVIRFLKVLGCAVWRENSGVVHGEKDGHHWAVHMAPLGTPDVSAVVPHGRWCPDFIGSGRRGCLCPRPWGLFLAVETKAPGEKVKTHQAMRHDLLRQVGALVLVAYTVQELRDGMRQAGLDVP